VIRPVRDDTGYPVPPEHSSDFRVIGGVRARSGTDNTTPTRHELVGFRGLIS